MPLAFRSGCLCMKTQIVRTTFPKSGTYFPLASAFGIGCSPSRGLEGFRDTPRSHHYALTSLGVLTAVRLHEGVFLHAHIFTPSHLTLTLFGYFESSTAAAPCHPFRGVSATSCASAGGIDVPERLVTAKWSSDVTRGSSLSMTRQQRSTSKDTAPGDSQQGECHPPVPG